jgi:hypothetical protein
MGRRWRTHGAVLLAAVALSACGASDTPNRGSAKREADPATARVPDPRAEQRRFWRWTRARELEARRIFARDQAVKPLFAHRSPTIVDSGPWNAEDPRKLLGGLLIVELAKPVHGIYRLPGITSYKTGDSAIFQVDVAGARRFHVVVSFKRQRVADVSPVGL